ncbi:ABC transporter ATP-binding protein [Alcaligenes sp. SMD-FA]|uniref:ABC transporter ATP-binding protein n=1 Tax=Alcaligenes sp. SMD-FA TaxID=2991054 RepID=UPI002226289A|nr:ABC transporter ATP-binding protein [Alcaligenes sp. SMD-FA]UYY86905.1 ABC transporter ATP-binding protein [Alcaligenes sp. SMD-FA]
MGTSVAALIQFQGFGFQYPGASAPVIRDVNLDVQAGHFVAIVGGSGVGKSTLLRAAAGLSRPSFGHLRSNLHDSPGRRANAFVFQDSRLLPWRRIASNVAYGLEGLGLSREERDQRVDAALNQVGLVHLKDRWPHQLSGGQVQRIGIARALAVQPDLLLMDEPFSAVDALTRQALQDELVQVWQRSAAAVLFVTHDIDEAVFLADTIIVLGGSPAGVSARIEVDLPRPRDRTTPRFGELVKEVGQAL